jgi:hypothetical protein
MRGTPRLHSFDKTETSGTGNRSGVFVCGLAMKSSRHLIVPNEWMHNWGTLKSWERGQPRRTRIDTDSNSRLKKAMRILGMPFWPEKISDEQYIEKIRKGLRFLGRWRFVIVLMQVIILVLFVWLIVQGLHLLRDMINVDHAPGQGGPTPAQQMVNAIYSLAIMVGGFIGFMLGNALSHVVTLLFGYRDQKLLVECWDALSDAEKARLRQRSS